MIKVNGVSENIDSINLMEYLEKNGYLKGRVAVECNEEIVPRAEFDSFTLKDGDVVEIVSFVGGGCC